MATLTTERARSMGRIGAAVNLSRRDGRELAAHARASYDRKLREQVDPDGTLDDAEVERRVKALRRAHALRMARKAVAVRAAKAAASGKVQCPMCGRWHWPDATTSA